MSNEAVKWAMDDAPMLRTDKGKPDTTARHVLQALAEHARPDGTNTHPSVLRLQYRTGFDRSTVQRALRRLETGKLIEKDGSVDGRAKWKLSMHLRRPESDWTELEREEEAERAKVAERVRRHRAKRVTHATPVTDTDSAPVTETPVTHFESARNALKVRDVTHAECVSNARNAALTTNQPPEQPPTTKDSLPAPPAWGDDEDLFGRLAAQSDAIHAQRETEDLSAFGAFWLLYPKKRDRAEALKAWKAAVKSGADPERITEGARQYARERAGQDPRYTKYPATWLNKGCYDDEPDPAPGQLRAVSGGYQPFRNPDNHDVYDEGLI